MEAILKEAAGSVALAAEIISVICIAIGGTLAIVEAGKVLFTGQVWRKNVRRRVFVAFAVWIILALEFALGADIVRTAIAPSWNDIGQLAAIAVIRTGLNFFLERDLAEFSRSEGEERGLLAPEA